MNARPPPHTQYTISKVTTTVSRARERASYYINQYMSWWYMMAQYFGASRDPFSPQKYERDFSRRLVIRCRFQGLFRGVSRRRQIDIRGNSASINSSKQPLETIGHHQFGVKKGHFSRTIGPIGPQGSTTSNTRPEAWPCTLYWRLLSLVPIVWWDAGRCWDRGSLVF